MYTLCAIQPILLLLHHYNHYSNSPLRSEVEHLQLDSVFIDIVVVNQHRNTFR